VVAPSTAAVHESHLVALRLGFVALDVAMGVSADPRPGEANDRSVRNTVVGDMFLHWDGVEVTRSRTAGDGPPGRHAPSLITARGVRLVSPTTHGTLRTATECYDRPCTTRLRTTDRAVSSRPCADLNDS
jgi:hypothetical protein